MTDQPPSQQPPPAPGPTPGYPPYPPYAYPPPVNMYAILALVFGAMVFPPLGIYFGNKAKKQIAQTGERGVELATAGLVVGWIFTAIYGLFVLVWCGFVGTMIVGSTAGR
ncbi:hypothetical protein DLE60_19670 [Micromonospora globispora]|uniref:DUF4190 domain-containing protein n=1 Tax=Micromonospora globispora TaxID=1450148 RepID=A0A317JUI1_9ACTN|nr:DUF4190 domain-containing protein [Micromonospora globispora]PWU44295.1 hypothetical protein DLJ46_26740 [Micromonospora globispora]PWU58828.1 hypothetical protein DLE60_19555 [Micromonospora globispora]PWU58845.1 hypothetical protein DLE60_19670 [Micromonospora globispora]RQX00452.1 hypothetical protein DKL51_06810 [Micromonospora globispora]